MEPEIEKLRRATAELQAWVGDLLQENRQLRDRIAAECDARHEAPAPRHDASAAA